MKRAWALAALLLITLTGCEMYSEADVRQTIEAVQQTLVATIELTASSPAVSTKTPTPVTTPRPGETPKPTGTPAPTATPIPDPEPILLSGKGDDTVEIDTMGQIWIAHIKGNASGRYFSVVTYDSAGEHLDSLVETVDPYDGLRLIDFMATAQITSFGVTATGEWSIELFPFTREYLIPYVMTVPGTVSGAGDTLVLLSGESPDVATITGNAGARDFVVVGYGDSLDVLIDTADPYAGTLVLDPNTILLEITAVGDWTIEVTAK